MEREVYGELLKNAFDLQLALVSNSSLKPEDFTSTQKEAKELFGDFEGIVRPWTGTNREDRKQREYDSYKQMWNDATGIDWDDEEALAEHSRKIEEEFERDDAQAMAEAREEADKERQLDERKKAVLEKRLKQHGR